MVRPPPCHRRLWTGFCGSSPRPRHVQGRRRAEHESEGFHETPRGKLMNITILYEALYHYEEKASLSPHIVRLFPRHDFSQQVNRTVFTTHESAQIHHRQDLFDNV